MRLRGRASRLHLELLGRPDPEGWLGVRVTAEGATGRWSSSSKCLQAADVERLAEWLERWAAGEARDADLDTSDGELRFELRAAESDLWMRVYLGYDLRPPRAKKEGE